MPTSAEDGALPDWMPTGAEEGVLPKLNAHGCWGCPSSMHDLRAPSPSHPACQSLPEPRVRCRSKMWQTEGEEKKTTGHLMPSLAVLERKACPDAKTKCFQSKNVLAPAHIYKLSHNKTKQITPNSSPRKGSHNSKCVSLLVFFLIKSKSIRLNRESISKLRYNQEWNLNWCNLYAHNRPKYGLTQEWWRFRV